MGDRVWQVPQDQFITVWNDARSLDEAAAKFKALVNGNVPCWAVMARAMSLRKDGIALKPLTRSVPLPA
ncbi:hypothetical protein VT84_22980 [Gemmata sp. SH-PL17]|uniref:hypothetical protein n=1 Tax=Gemmata sp. SH-PL17 TaxID=1630693 RepID=UPI0004AE305F|nr:hypothetical protein [Gemmata sp. SH-PL17]AMV27285.1 hypothetical protein VT84_22980 [Gemmata sp. SH-PL17]